MSSRALLLGIALLVTILTRPSFAFDLSGAWASSASACKNIFGTSPSGDLIIKNDADAYGAGFIVRGDTIVGQFVKCKIIKRKADQDVVHLGAACSTDVALSNIQFAFRIDADNKITRIYPGLEELNVPYWRCPSD